MLKGHLLSPEFFDTQRFPQLRFASTELSVGEDGSARVAGELEIRGETRRVEASGRFAHLGEDAYGQSPGRPLDLGRRSTGATSASTGRRSCRAAARSSSTR